MIYSFSGESKHHLDEKGRLSIPAKFRKWHTDDSDYTFVVTKGQDPCLVAYPSQEWDEIAKKLISLSQFNKRNRAFIRTFCRNAARLKCDKQGRVLIPQSLLDYANIEKDVIIIGTINSLEIWSPENFENHKESQISLDSEYFEDLGEKL